MAGSDLMQLAGGSGGGNNAPSLVPQQSAATAAATANALAMHQRAMIQGRDLVAVEQALEQDFRDKSLADEALYNLSFGSKSIQGLGIRAAEQCMYRMGSIVSETNLTPVGHDVLVTVNLIDLVTNVSVSSQAVVSGTVERRSQDSSRVLVGTRKNSRGEDVYIYPATPQEMMRDCGAMQSKLLRNGILRVLPPRTKATILDTVLRAREGEFKTSKTTAVKELVELFNNLRPSINATQLAQYLGHPAGEMTSDEYIALKGIANAIKEGAVTWKEVLEQEERKRGRPADVAGQDKSEK